MLILSSKCGDFLDHFPSGRESTFGADFSPELQIENAIVFLARS